MTGPLDWLADSAATREAAGLHRELRRMPPRGSGDAPLDLASNDYLGLAADERVRTAAAAAALEWGGGASASRLVVGNLGIHEDCEAALRTLTAAPAALLFSSGYLANLAAVGAVVTPGATIIADAENHASLIDAVRLASRPRASTTTKDQVRVAVAAHSDPLAVREALREHREGSDAPAVIVTDAVFSVDGTMAPLAELAELAAEFGAVLVVDEAHSLGVVGPGGAGALAASGIPIGARGSNGEPAVVATATLSKSLGSQGGAVLGSEPLRDHLVDSARSFIFDTGLAPASAGAALAALAAINEDPSLPLRARSAASGLHSRLHAALSDRAGRPSIPGVRLGPEPAAALVSVVMPGAHQAVQAAASLREVGIEVGCFRPPSVADGLSRLRFTARAVLTDAELDRAAEATVRALLEAVAIPPSAATRAATRAATQTTTSGATSDVATAKADVAPDAAPGPHRQASAQAT